MSARPLLLWNVNSYTKLLRTAHTPPWTHGTCSSAWHQSIAPHPEWLCQRARCHHNISPHLLAYANSCCRSKCDVNMQSPSLLLNNSCCFCTIYKRKIATRSCHVNSAFGIRSISTRRHFKMFNKLAMDVPEGLFRGSIDRFNGVIVESKTEYQDGVDFLDKLKKSLDYWIAIKRRAIWFYVKKEHAAWVSYLAKNGFDFHHVQDGAVVMCRWLPTDEKANLPDYCHTMLGVGCLVINKNNEVLVVTDRFALIPNSWKLPGGYVEPSENLVDGAIREVKEETGISCRFKTVVSMRHSHKGSFNCSDLYVVVGLIPENLNITPCEREIARARWMPISEFIVHPNVHETNRKFLRLILDYDKKDLCFTVEKRIHEILKKEYWLYYVESKKDPSREKVEVKETLEKPK